MFGFLLLAFLVVPILELYVFVQVSDAIGFLPTVFWIVAVSVIGAWLVKREGLGALGRANAQVARGEVPTNALVDGILILFAGALMLTPGFLTDAVGVLLLAPPSRAVIRGGLKSRFRRHGPIVVTRGFASGPGGGPFGPGRDPAGRGPGTVWDADSWESGSWGPGTTGPDARDEGDDPSGGPDRPQLG